jgi:phage shock protein PspC (stress-responsive transcriptional regulator)
MKKVISIHLDNKVFQIEEDAYTYMNNVLNKQWKKQELEVQIAERLQQKLTGSKTVIIFPDVVDVLYQLGFPIAENLTEGTGLREKRLYRQIDNKMVGGLCMGLAEYLEIDVTLIRVLFVIALFMAGIGFWLYIVLWIIVPKSPKSLNV